MEGASTRLILEQLDKLQYQITSIKSDVATINSTIEDFNTQGQKQINALQESITLKNEESDKKYSDVYEQLQRDNLKYRNELISQFGVLQGKVLSDVNKLDVEHTQRDTQIYNTINALSDRINKIHIDIINNDDNIAITYTDHKGKIEYGSILKVRADDKTLVQDINGVIGVKYKFDNKSFVNENDVIIPTKIRTSSGEYISAEYIKNDLGNATYNIESLTKKLERLQKQLSTSNGYIASNNFKSSQPTQEKLTAFVLDCLRGSIKDVTKDQIPSGTKIKNTFDNHIWVFNKISNGGLTTYKWEDFGSDNICVAGNDGVHGLVTGSNERFEGHIDLKGVITINGLSEELESMIQGALQMKSTLQEQENKITILENRLRQIEEGR